MIKNSNQTTSTLVFGWSFVQKVPAKIVSLTLYYFYVLFRRADRKKQTWFRILNCVEQHNTAADFTQAK